jgi:hypothetical protein
MDIPFAGNGKASPDNCERSETSLSDSCTIGADGSSESKS